MPVAMSSLSSSESTTSGFFPETSLNRARHSDTFAVTPPTSVAPSSSPIKSGSPVLKNCLDSPTAPDHDGPTLDSEKDSPAVKRSAAHASERYKRPRAQYALSQGGDHNEDLELPSKRFKALQTTWNYTEQSSDTSNYLNERMLELSRVTRRVVTARMRYQRLRIHELDLIKSILDDENEQTGTQLKTIDSQIGALRNMLDEGGVTEIGDKGRRKFDPSVLHDEPWLCGPRIILCSYYYYGVLYICLICGFALIPLRVLAVKRRAMEKAETLTLCLLHFGVILSRRLNFSTASSNLNEIFPRPGGGGYRPFCSIAVSEVNKIVHRIVDPMRNFLNCFILRVEKVKPIRKEMNGEIEKAKEEQRMHDNLAAKVSSKFTCASLCTSPLLPNRNQQQVPLNFLDPYNDAAYQDDDESELSEPPESIQAAPVLRPKFHVHDQPGEGYSTVSACQVERVFSAQIAVN
ncbi:hypothetical protein EDB19DRAFT_1835272 [Suillus lakei]|nr:hypothetical protein EDB19DRAFT_1835272 [Suillus lakei]